VISVHILCLDDCFNTTIMSQLTEITQFIFGQPLTGKMPLQVLAAAVAQVVKQRRRRVGAGKRPIVADIGPELAGHGL
jgi:hypothetical protein